jgi:hypothetical protein
VVSFSKNEKIKQDFEDTPSYLRMGLELGALDDIPEDNRLINRI